MGHRCSAILAKVQFHQTNLSRRDFLDATLRMLAAGALSPLLLQGCVSRKSAGDSFGLLMAPSHVPAPDGAGTFFGALDLDSDTLEEFIIPLEFPHVAVGHPKLRDLAVVPESGGVGACVVSLSRKAVLQRLRAGAGRVFGGHAAFTASGDKLVFSEFEPSGKGFVSVWNGETFTLERAYPTGGRFPHDVTIARGGNTITASNLGVEVGKHVKASGVFVSRIDLRSGKLLERLELQENPEEIDASPRIGGKDSLAANDKVMRTDASYFISYLGLVAPQMPMFLYPHAHQKVVAAWSIGEKKLIREFLFDQQPMALAVLPRRSHFAVVLSSGEVQFFHMKTLNRDASISLNHKLKVTTHVTAWSKTGEDSHA